MPPESQGLARANVSKAICALKRGGHDPYKETFFVTCDSSMKRSSRRRGILPCLTHRANGHWITSRGRRIRLEEMMRLQGMGPTQFIKAASDAQLRAQLGNTMSVNVIERILMRVLPAAGLVRHGILVDRWEMDRP